jgi:hypothetical protein
MLIKSRKMTPMPNDTRWRWRRLAAAALAAALLSHGASSARSAEALAPLGNTVPAEIPEPSSDVPSPKRAKKAAPAAPVKAKEATNAAPAQAASKSAPAVAPGTSPPPAKTAAKPEATTQSVTARNSSKPAPASQPATAASTQKSEVVSTQAKDDSVSETDALVPFVRKARDQWQVALTFDDYWLSAPITEGNTGTQSGNLYGLSLSFAPPDWHGDTSFDFSYRQGLLHGNVGYPRNYSAAFETFVNEAIIGFSFKTLPWMHNGKERGHVLSFVGLSWDGWSTTETLANRKKWPATLTPELATDWNMIMANLGLGYDLTLWNPSTAWLDYRLGIRVMAIGAMGGSNFNQQGGENLSALALYGLARGTVYMNFLFYHTVGVFVEGGYQESWWLFSDNPTRNVGVNEFHGYWGGFGRAGLEVQF